MDYHFSEKGKQIVNYLIGEEYHENGELHYHAFLEFDSRIDTCDPRYFDVDGLHPNIGDKPSKKWCDYCAKGGNYITNFYVPKVSPYKRALEVGGQEGIDIIKEACPRDWVMNKNKIIAAMIEPYEGDRRVIWVYGREGLGKSHIARGMGAKPCKYKNGFYSYKGAPVVVFEEIDKQKMPLDEFLTITDKWETEVNLKGAYCNWAAHTVIFTATQPWDAVFVHEHSGQVERRITDIIEFTGFTEFIVHKGSFSI